MESRPKQRVIKVCILGGTGVGKSSILRRFVTNEFSDSEQTTLGAAFMDKVFTFNDKTYRFQIWDTAGQEKYAPLAHMYYRDTEVALLVYDITNKDSFAVLKDWHKEILEKGPANILIGCVGNKIDLLGREEVTGEMAKEFTNSVGGFLKFTSAKENKGISDVFSRICEYIQVKDREKEHQEEGGGKKYSLMDPVPEKPKEKGTCC